MYPPEYPDDEEADFEEFEEEHSKQEKEVDALCAELAMKFVGLSPEALQVLSQDIGNRLASQCTAKISGELKQLVSLQCGEEVKRLAKERCESVFAEVLATKIVTDASKWSGQKTTSIADIIKEQMETALKSLSQEKTRSALVKEALDTFLSKELVKIANDAVLAFRQETMEDIKKMATRQFIETIAKAVAGDKKLLALLSV